MFDKLEMIPAQIELEECAKILADFSIKVEPINGLYWAGDIGYAASIEIGKRMPGPIPQRLRKVQTIAHNISMSYYL